MEKHIRIKLLSQLTKDSKYKNGVKPKLVIIAI